MVKQRDLLETVELLKQDLAIEPDLQNFIGFVLESVNKLGGDAFAATIALLKLAQRLRDAGAVAGYPMQVNLILQGHHLLTQWGQQKSARIADFARLPPREEVEKLRSHLQHSTVLTDPVILLQRNAQMVRHLDEIRARTEKEIAMLQQAAEVRHRATDGAADRI